MENGRDQTTSIEVATPTSARMFRDRINKFVIPMKRAIDKASGVFSSIFSKTAHGPDFQRLTDYIELESLLKVAVLRHTEQIINAGWTIQSKNTEAARYIQGRLYEMGQRSGEPYEITIHQCVESMVRNSNAMLYLKRNKNLSPGSPVSKTQGTDLLPPIASMEALPVADAEPVIDDKLNMPKQWRFGVHPHSRYRDPLILPRQDVLHMYFDRQPGNTFGTPWMMSVLDDIQDLRAVEAVVNSIISQQGAPLIHIKIENPVVQDRESGRSEIDIVYEVVRAGALEAGVYVSDARHSIEVVANEAKLDAYQWAIEHYKTRIREGCNLSDIDLGSGSSANRNTASSLTDKGIDRCKLLAVTIESFLNMFLIDALLMESGRYKWDYGNDRNRVLFQFNEIDIDRSMRKEIHATMLWESSGLPHDEYRRMIGKEPFTEQQWKDAHIERVLVRQIEARGAVSAVGGSTTGIRSGGQARQQQTGLNQHGVSPRPKVVKNSALLHKLSNEALEHYRAGLAISGKPELIGNTKMAETYFRIADRIIRAEHWIDNLPAEQRARAQQEAQANLGNLIRSEAFLVGAGDLQIENPQRND